MDHHPGGATVESLTELLTVAASVVGLCKGTYDIIGIFRRLIGSRAKAPTRTVLNFLTDLGCRSDREVRRLVETWEPPVPLADEKREELITFLIALTHGARTHTTHGTPSSGYCSCEEVIGLLLAVVQPKRHRGE